MWKQYYVYIMSNEWLTIYTGVTNSLQRRVNEHKAKANPGFTSKYDVNRLVYFEEYADITQAVAREKQIKGWKRFKKVALIRSANPNWLDLASGPREGASFATDASLRDERQNQLLRSPRELSASPDDPSPAMKPRVQDDSVPHA